MISMLNSQGGSSSESLSGLTDALGTPPISKTSYTISANTTKGNPPEKTISCVSCRKRKLRCDRVKPRCGTCTRLRHECEFPERRRNLGSKRRNMKELEARLAQVETKLVSEVEAHKSQKSKKRPSMTNIEDIQDLDLDIGNVTMDSDFGNERFDFSFIPTPPSIPVGNPISQELISMGLDEPLPPQHMIDELEKLYFEKFHVAIPMMHKYRYYASLDRAPHLRPPICLRYAIWSLGASISEAYGEYEDILYNRARKYAEAAEMKGFGETFVTTYHAQTWGLISLFEAKRTYFSRSWMSTGRAVRLCHMLGLHRLDGDKSDVKQILPPPRDWIEMEERRRTFWAAFYADRSASSATGWPLSIEESDILTNLPASEESFERGVEENTVSLAEALTPGGAPRISPCAGVILSASLFGHNFQHLHRTSPNERPHDYLGGDFWTRHRKMDNVLSNTFMFLPDHLRVPNALRDLNVIFMHMNIHASIICLQQAAIVTAERHGISRNVIKQCRDRSLMAAQEIISLMRLCSPVDVSQMHSWVGFCLYVAAGVCLRDATNESQNPESIHNVEFILDGMNSAGQKHSITKHFAAQLELDVEASGLGKLAKQKNPDMLCPIFQERGGIPTTVHDTQRSAKGDMPTGQEWPEQTPIGGASARKSFEARTDNAEPLCGLWRQHDGRNSSIPPLACIGEPIPSMTPMRPPTSVPEEDHSRPYTNLTLLPPNGLMPTLDHSPHLSIRFPLRSAEPSYPAISVAHASWPPPQPGIEQPGFAMTGPAWYNPESLNSPRDPELDALLDGIVWDSHPGRD